MKQYKDVTIYTEEDFDSRLTIYEAQQQLDMIKFFVGSGDELFDKRSRVQGTRAVQKARLGSGRP